MHMIRFFVLFMSLCPAFAAETGRCPSLTGAQAAMDCVLSSHPSVRSADALLSQSEAFEGAAGQRPNPEAEAGALVGDSKDQVEVGILHTFETAGKRRTRMEKARAERDALRAEAVGLREELAVETAVRLHRLRQIREEVALLKEALATYSRIAGQLSSRPRRSPEQQVSLSVFQLAQRDSTMRLSSLESEEAAGRRGLELGLQRPLAASDDFLPKPIGVWPPLGVPGAAVPLSGSAALGAAAAEASAQAEVGAARAASYPDVRMGPLLSSEKEGAGQGSTMLIGLGFSLPLPLYQRNAAGRLLAVRGSDAAAARSKAALAVLGAERDIELARYRAATEALVKAAGHSDQEAEHRELEELFDRGLIPSALVIEAHRQLLDYMSHRHELELSAVRSVWTVYALEGRALTEKL